MSKMNEQIKKEWCEALRSDEYLQGINQLKCRNKYCCLGVLADLFIKSEEGAKLNAYWQSAQELEAEDAEKWSDEVDELYRSDVCLDAGDLPNDVKEWAGLSSVNPTVQYKPRGQNEQFTNGLVYLNDCEALDFHQIADLIEQQL